MASRVRSDAEQQVAELLRTARKALGLSLAFLSRLDGVTQHLEVVESALPFFRDGQTQVQETSLCQAVLEGHLPAVMPDLSRHRDAMALPAFRKAHLRSYVTVPVRLSDGSLYGTFCAAGVMRSSELSARDKVLMDVLAHAASVIVEPGVLEQRRRAEILARFAPVLAGRGLQVLLQPIIDLKSGHRPGAEALSRFPHDWGKPPDVCFQEGHSVGAGQELELLALRGALDLLDRVGGYVAMNASPSVVMLPEFTELVRTARLDRVVVELSEHDPVEDYAALSGVLDPLRADGVRLAIDDVGSGFSSLRHIVLTAPDVIKLDRSIVHNLSQDPVIATLVRSLVQFGHGSGASVVAEGIETEQDADAALRFGVDLGQGWFFGRPGPPESLDASVADEGRHQPGGDGRAVGEPLLGVRGGHRAQARVDAQPAQRFGLPPA